jgi:hypothetical protein
MDEEIRWKKAEEKKTYKYIYDEAVALHGSGRSN